MRLTAPVPRPSKIIGAGLNYRSHAEELGLPIPAQPILFLRLPSAVIGPHDDIVLPVGRVDWEAELVVVMGRRGRHIPVGRAWEHVAGLTCGQDVSHRDEQDRGGEWMSIAKSFDTFAPIGPVLVTPDELEEPNDLSLACWLDGELVQSTKTSDMVFTVPELVARISTICTLEPGDLIFTGTPPGVGMGRRPPRFLANGNVLETEIQGIGRMTNRCVAEGSLAPTA